ncbi:protein kinase domain-containing protein [Sorangium sp. So ce1389]|uniref:serine/threonine-protein kinase n=1 Tax=Sorangium sp. So ce1389 TaxID=3133336 RepID=UPI003F6491D0
MSATKNEHHTARSRVFNDEAGALDEAPVSRPTGAAGGARSSGVGAASAPSVEPEDAGEDVPVDVEVRPSSRPSRPSRSGWVEGPASEAPSFVAPPPLRQKTPRFGRQSDPDIDDAGGRTSAAPVSEAEPSMEIPPPDEVEPRERRPPGAKDPYIGTTFDHRYKIERLLGEGGMGYVYLARHKVIDKRVAVKVLRAELARDREIFERFVQEARAASSIGNPHIVDISDFGDLPDGSTYFVMEYLEGVSLAQLIDSPNELPMDRICHIALQLSAGLAAAHEAGIIHRDLKPDNVFVVARGSDPNFVKILDFGIAKVSTSTTTKLTRAGAVFGTPHYMSPEQAAGAPIDHRTDIYSLGVMLYELVSRQLPFNADNFMGILTQHMYKAPVPIRALVGGPDCPPGLEAVILKCLSKKPESRYQTMGDLHADLERVKGGGVPGAVAEMMARSGGFNVPHDYFKTSKVIVPATPPSPPRSPWPRYVWVAGAAAAVGIVTAIFVIGGSGSASHTAAPAPKPPVEAPAAAPTPGPAPVQKAVVALAAVPETAVGYRNGVEMKLPASIDIERGQTVTIDIRAEGYVPSTVVLDGTEPSKLVKLVEVDDKGGTKARPGGAGRPPATPSTVRTPKGSDVRDPWAKEKK